MARRLTSSKISKIIITIFIILGLLCLSYWLWQRQPKAPVATEPAKSVSDVKNQDAPKQTETLNISPKDGTVLTDSKIKFAGKASPGEYILIYSNSLQGVVRAGTDGKFQADAELSPGLNIVGAITLKEDFSQNRQESLSLYLLAKDDPKESKAFFAGTVKNIFDKTITLATSSGEKTFRQKTSTKLILPESAAPAGKQQSKADSDIRVGDYLIVLGNQEGEKEFNALSVAIIRVDKPQNATQFMAGQLLTSTKSNLFSAKDLKDSKIAEFTIDKNSKILTGDKEGSAKDISKDKKAIIFYKSPDNKNVVQTVYLLP